MGADSVMKNGSSACASAPDAETVGAHGHQTTVVRTLRSSLVMSPRKRDEFVAMTKSISYAVSRNMRRASLFASCHFLRMLENETQSEALCVRAVEEGHVLATDAPYRRRQCGTVV